MDTLSICTNAVAELLIIRLCIGSSDFVLDQPSAWLKYAIQVRGMYMQETVLS